MNAPTTSESPDREATSIANHVSVQLKAFSTRFFKRDAEVKITGKSENETLQMLVEGRAVAQVNLRTVLTPQDGNAPILNASYTLTTAPQIDEKLRRFLHANIFSHVDPEMYKTKKPASNA